MKPKETIQPEALVHLVKINLCELCLQGAGEECHTPGCALFLHNSPGLPIAPEMYEIVNKDNSKECVHPWESIYRENEDSQTFICSDCNKELKEIQ